MNMDTMHTTSLSGNHRACRRFAVNTADHRLSETKHPHPEESKIQKHPKKQIPADFDIKNYVRKTRIKHRNVLRRPNIFSSQADLVQVNHCDDATNIYDTSSLYGSSPDSVISNMTQLQEMMAMTNIGTDDEGFDNASSFWDSRCETQPW